MTVEPLVQLLSTNGDGSGETSIIGDYSGSPTEFLISAPEAGVVSVVRLIVYVEDRGSFDSGNRFGNGLRLRNGIRFEVRGADDDVVSDLTPDPITQNGHWAKYAHDCVVNRYGQGAEYLSARWTFGKFIEDGIDLRSGRKLVAIVNDDLSDLVDFTIVAEGYRSD